MEWYVIGTLMIVTLVILSLTGVPLAACLGLTAFGFLATGVGLQRAGLALNSTVVEMWSSYSILAVPLFIFMSEFLFAGGVTENLFEMASKWFGRLPGGLAVASVAASAVFGALCGSSIAAIATIGIVTIPQMLKRGYDKRLATGCVANAGCLAHIIPPSVMAVLYAALVEVSPAQQQIAGLIPGIILAFVFAGVVIIWALVKPAAAPREPAVPWIERFAVLKKVGGPAVIVVAVLGVIYTGIATVTEAAAIGAVAAIVLALTSRKLTRSNFFDTLIKAAKTSSFILFIAVGGKFFGWVLNYFTVPQHIADALVATNWNGWVIMAMIQVMFIVLGCFVDPIGIMFTTVPILQPIVEAFGFDLIWFGVLFLVNMEMAHVTPPLGFSLFIIKNIVGDKVALSDIIWGSLVFCIGTLAVLILIMAFPEIALWLPGKMS
ncbi:MAG: TRAP transporter large permease subunit [Dehalococcoidales bacterium]|nr:TRAP transporter large permease subunit [Dehalococcoidales bacterium]